jgi:hypothetical protein
LSRTTKDHRDEKKKKEKSGGKPAPKERGGHRNLLVDLQSEEEGEE